MKNVSPALARSLGFTGFLVFGLGCFYFGNAIFNLGIDVRQGLSGLGAKGWGWLILSFLVGFFGMTLGWRIAFSIKVRSEKVDYAISVIWHYLANGFILWFIIWVMYLTKKMGQEGSKEFMEEFGYVQFTFHLVGTGVVICLLMTSYLLLSGQLKIGTKSKMLPSLFITIPLTMAMSHVFLRSLGIDSYAWIGTGIIFPVVLMPFSAFMIERDRFEKMKIQEKGGE